MGESNSRLQDFVPGMAIPLPVCKNHTVPGSNELHLWAALSGTGFYFQKQSNIFMLQLSLSFWQAEASLI